MIVDSSVLVPLSKVGRLDILRKYSENIRIPHIVYRETVEETYGRSGVSEIDDALSWSEVVKLGKGDVAKAREIAKAEGIEQGDAEVLLLAEKEKDILLTNDKILIDAAKVRGVKAIWLTTLVLKTVKRGILTKGEGRELIYELVRAGMRLNIEVYATIQKRLEEL